MERLAGIRRLYRLTWANGLRRSCRFGESRKDGGDAMGSRRAGFTIGYGGRVPGEFTKLLAEHGVKTIVDVRLRPDKAAMGIYAKAKDADKGIAGLLAKAGIGYVSLPELGNVFMEYDDWLERYEKYLAVAGPLLFDRFADVSGPI